MTECRIAGSPASTRCSGACSPGGLAFSASSSFEVMEERPAMSFEAELAKDVITLMTVFCARLYGRRSHHNKEVAGDAAGPSTGPPHPPHKSAIVSAP